MIGFARLTPAFGYRQWRMQGIFYQIQHGPQNKYRKNQPSRWDNCRGRTKDDPDGCRSVMFDYVCQCLSWMHDMATGCWLCIFAEEPTAVACSLSATQLIGRCPTSSRDTQSFMPQMLLSSNKASLQWTAFRCAVQLALGFQMLQRRLSCQTVHS